ncbi:MAG: hypothetical protein WDO70_09665 [Alphaproteobacteria bacterium]
MFDMFSHKGVPPVIASLLAFAVGIMTPAAAMAADTGNSTLSLRQALFTNNQKPLFARDEHQGLSQRLSLTSSSFSGRASGNDPSAGHSLAGLGVLGQSGDRLAELEGDQRVFALLIDGKYDFSFDFGTGLALHPYIGGGLGMAVYEASSRSGLSGDGESVPLFRLTSGVTYKLGQDWDLSLNYKAGYSGSLSGSNVFTGRDQQKVDLHSLDMGLKLKF